MTLRLRFHFTTQLAGQSAAILLLLCSCSSTEMRTPASSAQSTPPPLDSPNSSLMSSVDQIQSDFELDTFGNDCVTYLQNLQAEMVKLNAWQILPEDTKSDEVLAQKIWTAQLTLHDFIPKATPECVQEIRNTSRLFRFAEDYLLEKAHKVTALNPSNMDYTQVPIPIEQTDNGYVTYTRNGTPAPFQFKNGDVMLARGFSFLSATIARIGDIQGQFSHVIFVHVDSQTQKVETIESYVGVGVQIYDIDTALRNENVRLSILRAKDQDLASRAADYMYERVKTANASGHPIPYDYQMDSTDHASMSCQEVVQTAFQVASDGGVLLPQYPSHISEDTSFLKRLNMKQGDTFMPGDLEVDPHFNLIGEWRDLRTTQDSRQKDAILTSILKWIDQDGYELHNSFNAVVTGKVLYHLRKTFIWPAVERSLHLQDFSGQIPKHTLQTVVLLDQVGGILLDHVRTEDAAFEKTHGWPMSYNELYSTLEQYRQKDLAAWENPKTRSKAQFHSLLRPTP